MSAPVRKFASLQILRAVAAWTVVFHHYMQLYFDFKSESGIGNFFSQYGSLGVDVFFVLSGFVMYLLASKSTKGSTPFLIDRLFRIAPIYWFYSALVVACIYVFPRGFAYTDFNLKSLLTSALFLPSWNPSGLGMYPVLTVGWTLNFEMFFYVALACFMAVSSRHFMKILLVVLTMLPLIYPSGAYFSQVAGSFKLYEFLAGALLAMVWTGATGAMIRRYYAMSLAVTFACILTGVGLLILRNSYLPIAVSIVAFTLLCEPHLRLESRIVRALVRLGDESYSTYLSHCIVIGILIHLTGKNLGQSAQLLALLAVTFGVYIVSSLSYRWLERSKHVDATRIALVRRLGARSQPNAVASDLIK